MTPFWLLPVFVVTLVLWPPRIFLSYVTRKTGVLFHFNTTEKVAYITIDDGPSEFTPQILSTLDKLNIKATFFLIGDRMKQHPQLVQQIYAAGHGIANHDVSTRRSVFVPIPDLTRDLLSVNRLLEELARIASRYFRPGCGYFSAAMVKTAESLGLRVLLGDVFPFDPFMPTFWMKLSLRYKTQPGSVIILHDGTKHRADKVCDTLSSTIPELKRQGYKFPILP